ncbi:hypothetical protein ELS24_10275 [Achromobacter spanius]|uniref:hypothetical protein n=1 Tax=Achromobacter spanius TaxID=217203 RepID=UPI000F8F9DC0|nr:hypothetical protein [Achromobacter spanius]AZS78796.1 hypothetical protein ELS24_10275 [Achromobacter spanius]
MAADAAGDAAAGQQQAAQDANALQQQIYDRNTENFQPYLNAGGAGLNALLFRLGLGSGTGGRDLTEQEIRNELMGQYTTAGQSGSPPPLASLLTNARDRGYSNAQWGFDPQANRWGYQLEYIMGGDAGGTSSKWVYADPQGATSDTVDEAGLNAAVQQRLAQQNAAKSDPNYGWLLKRFSETDWQTDPGYQFRLDQGNNALSNMAAATGNLNSGRALKDAIAYSSGQASQEYGNAYSRFNTDQTNQYNRLAALAGMGQSSASALAGVGQNYANQVGNNLAQGANAAAAGAVGQSNALNQGLGGLANAGLNYAAMTRQSGYTPSGPAFGNLNGLYGASWAN